ncbi:hypothetical protein COMNV_01662 [Commensalibacter sp. Nvir]|uniref:SPOR domain-containing protein n=1 Tax=Commensalibacter sp. Nvir TaxID=3069817 RepID=UPI002D6E0016|nr:hypothetical protein COMNV_01662 [Commensalibacter sp. Nvir]
MVDPHSPEPPKRKSFFEDDFSQKQDEPPQPNYHQPIYPERERMASRYDGEDDEEYRYEDEIKRSSFPRCFDVFGDGGWNTRHLIYAASGIGGLLVLFIGSWLMYNSTEKGIPVFSPPSKAAKEKPINTNNTETIGIGIGETVSSDPNSSLTTLAPGPEQANPLGLAEQYGSKPQPAGKSDNKASQIISSQNTDNTTLSSENSEPLSSSKTTHQTLAPQKSLISSDTQTDKVNSKLIKSEKFKTSVFKSPKMNEKGTFPSGSFKVQLSALASEEGARKQWKMYLKKAPDILNQHNLEIQRADVGGKIVYRLRIKGFSSKNQANEFCSKLKARSISCTFANF